MEESMASIDGGLKTTAGSCFHHGQSFDELKQLLVCASIELESARAAAKAQSQLHEARVRHLEELLKTTRRERDEARDQCIQLQERFSRSPSRGLLADQRTGVPQLESVSSMTEPTRATLTEVHRKLQEQHELKQKLDSVSSVSSMTEPTRATLTEVHRKLQEQQQQQQQQLELQQLEMQQQLQHQIDLQHQQTGHSQLDYEPSPGHSHMDFHPHQHQQQLEELQQHLELHIEGVPTPHVDQRSPQSLEDLQQHLHQQQEEQLKMHLHRQQESEQLLSHLQQRQKTEVASLLLQEEQPLHHKVSQHQEGLSSSISAGIQGTSSLHHQLTQHSEGLPPISTGIQGSSPLHHPLSQHQEGLTPMSTGIQGSSSLHHQLSQHQEGLTPMSTAIQGSSSLHHQLSQHQEGLSSGLQGANDGAMNMSVRQHSSWPGVLGSTELGQVSIASRTLPGVSDMTSMPCYLLPALSAPQLSSGLSEQLLQSSCLQGGSVVASILSPLDSRYGDSASNPLLLPRPVHLPEPPEADPQVMLSSLPEKGKLLQAVMQAGPLLQTLLLAGPLPQWRHPPPPLDSEEIPRVSMGASSVILPPVEQAIGLMASHGSRDQVMRLSTPSQSSPSQNGLCHNVPSISVASVSSSLSLSTQSRTLRVSLGNGHSA